MKTTTLVSLLARTAPLLLAMSAVHAADAGGADVTVAALSAPTKRSDLTAATDAYALAVQQSVQRRAHYPDSREARQLRPEGTATVWLEIDGSGRLIGSGISQSSHSSLLDASALQTVRVARYPAFGGSAERRSFVMPVEFVADGNH